MFRIVRVRRRRAPSKKSSAKYVQYKEEAREIAHARIAHFNRFYRVEIKRVAIKNSRTRWGSCSSRGNLNFNYRLALIDPALVDYVVVHELCHLIHFNHSAEFWAEVARAVPNWALLRRELRAIKL